MAVKTNFPVTAEEIKTLAGVLSYRIVRVAVSTYALSGRLAKKYGFEVCLKAFKNLPKEIIFKKNPVAFIQWSVQEEWNKTHRAIDPLKKIVEGWRDGKDKDEKSDD
jgi:hypothetical protein